MRHGKEQVGKVYGLAHWRRREYLLHRCLRHVDKDEVLLYCASVGATHHLTSAKSGAGVSEAFTELMRSELRGTVSLLLPTQAARLLAAGVASKKKATPALAGAKPAAAASDGGAGASARQKLAIVDDEPERKDKKGGCC